MPGFFASHAPAAPPPSLLPKCGICGLWKHCDSPKMPVVGKGRRGIMVIGEGPGQSEDRDGKPFVGKSGQRLQSTLRELGVELFRDCWVTNSLICRPTDDGKNRKPTPAEIDHCRPNVLNAIKERQPEVILLLGGVAIRSVIGPLWKDDPGGSEQWAGWRIPNHKPNAWITPTFHPSYILRMETEKGKLNPVPQMFFKRHLEAALALSGRPWPAGPPNYAKDVETTLDAAYAAQTVRKMIARGGPVAFDYETDRLKPDSSDSQIVSCAVCWRGKKTIAYPWHGDAITATLEFLRSSLPKVAANLKFESRFSMAVPGVRVRNWFWDTMVDAHLIDSREGITGLKFQAFVQFGQPPYDEHVKPFLKSDGTNAPNRIKEVDLRELLQYNAMDSLLEYKLMVVQTKQMGVSVP